MIFLGPCIPKRDSSGCLKQGFLERNNVLPVVDRVLNNLGLKQGLTVTGLMS